MKKVIMIGFLIGSLHQGAFASASGAPSSDSSEPKYIFDLPGDCPSLKLTSSAVAKAIAPDMAKDLVPFMIKSKKGDVWRVSRDPNETNMAIEDIGKFPRIVSRGVSYGMCQYFYYYKVDIRGRAIPLRKVIQLQKMEPVEGK